MDPSYANQCVAHDGGQSVHQPIDRLIGFNNEQTEPCQVAHPRTTNQQNPTVFSIEIVEWRVAGCDWF